MNKNFVAELRWRGMLHQDMPGTEEQLNKEMTTGYIGFDPTASSLHIGSMVPIMILKHFQLAGHKPIALIGGATGMIGDPSGKSKERNLLSEEALRANIEGIRKQMEKLLDFDCGDQSAVLVNNYDWYKDVSLLHFLREVGKHLTVSYMMAKDSVKNRLETGLSFTEFSYQLFQGYDFYHLYKNHGCKLQMGGSDQWGNITTGTELIRRKDGGEVFALTSPLMTKSDGAKFGKSEDGNVWLDPERTSPYKFYQFWLGKGINDEDLSKLLRYFTTHNQETIEAWDKEYENNPKALRKILAEDITARVHSKEAVEQAQKATNLLFGKSKFEDFEATSEAMLKEVFEGVDKKTISRGTLDGYATGIDLIAETMDMSKGEIRRLLKNNGFSVNQQKISFQKGNEKPDFRLFKNKHILLRKGKDRYVLLTIED